MGWGLTGHFCGLVCWKEPVERRLPCWSSHGPAGADLGMDFPQDLRRTQLPRVTMYSWLAGNRTGSGGIQH